jgi:hypothetical protein
MKQLLFKILIFVLFLSPNQIFSQSQKLSDQARVSVLTCGSGNELYSIYGHTALRINDIEKNIDVVYNYGMFDFRTPNFYLKFVKGDMQYFMGACSFQDFMYEYQVTNRAVFEQNLLISTAQKQKIFDELNKSLFSDDKYYTYKFIDKNCTTMVLDKINAIFGSKIVSKKSDENNSYRKILYGYLDNHFWENFGINIIFGQKVDNKATKLFLPKELMENLKTTRFKGNRIVNDEVILNNQVYIEDSFSFWNSIYFYTMLLIIIILANKKLIFLIYLTVLGLLGCFFSSVGLYSFHEEIWWNYNVLLFNPTLLLFVYFWFTKNKKWILRLINFNLISIFFYMFMIISKIDFLMLLPMIITSSIILMKFRKKVIDL